MKSSLIWLLGLVILVWVWLQESSPDFETMAKNRLDYARQNQGDIHIVLFQDDVNSSVINGQNTYLNGALLAIEQINQRPGKLIGRTLKAHIEKDGASFQSSKRTIRQVANTPKITAVLGHADTAIAIPASVAYDRSQMIFIPPFATAQGLTSHNFQYVFRMMPNVKIMAEELAVAAEILGYKKVVILYSRDDINREIAFLFEDAALQMGIELPQNSSFFAKDTNHRPLISQFNSKAFDAVFIAASPEASAEMAKQLREMGIKKPILGTEVLNVPTYAQNAGAAAENTIVPSVYKPNKNNWRNILFRRLYEEKYAIPADTDAAQGYDSVMLLAAAIQRAGSTIPPLLSASLHYLPAWIGVTGLHGYDSSGDLQGKKFFFNVWQQAQWKPLPGLHIPYLLGRFDKSLPAHDGKNFFFTQTFMGILSSSEHKRYLLDLAQIILKFSKIGIIFEDTAIGKTVSGYNLLQQVADEKGFKVVPCNIAFSQLGKKQIERELVNCFSKLSLSTDTQYVAPFEGVSPTFVNKLSRLLPLFKSSTISLEGKKDTIKLSLILDKRSDIDPLGLGDMQVYRSLLNGIKVHELAESLRGLPEISINLEELQKLGVADKQLLLLSPDSFMDSNSGLSQGVDTP